MENEKMTKNEKKIWFLGLFLIAITIIGDYLNDRYERKQNEIIDQQTNRRDATNIHTKRNCRDFRVCYFSGVNGDNW